MSADDSITLRAVSVDAYITDQQVLRFPPPYLRYAAAPAKFDYAWRQLQFAFEFVDPSTAHPADASPTEPDLALIKRFTEKAKSLARSPFLAYPTTMTIHLSDSDTEAVTTDFPHEENERGFMTLLRQFANEHEPASFKAVQSVATLDDRRRRSGSNEAILRNWGKYHKKLLHRPPAVWLQHKAHPGEPWDKMVHGNGPRIDVLLRTYFYGDLIHFGEGRDDLEALNADTFGAAWYRMLLFDGATGLAMYYMGYAELLTFIYFPDEHNQSELFTE